MTTILKLAWRNIWRNKRRTFITALAVAFAVFFSSFLTSFQKGVWDGAVDNSVNMFFGFAQVHQNGYSEEQILDNAFDLKATSQSIANSSDKLAGFAPRLESFALASEGEITRGVLVMGIDPVKENELTKLESKVIDGQYLSSDDKAVMVGSGLAEKLKLSVGDTMVLISQGYHGVNAAGKYPVKSIFKYALPDLNKQMVYMPLATAQQFYGAEGLVTTLALKINDKKDVDAVVAATKTQLGDGYEVKDWQEMLPELLQARELDTAGKSFIMFLLYTLIGFGIFGTILMMTKEREYEFGVLTAIGMRKGKLASIIWLETIFIAFLGALLGILMSMPLVYYLHTNPLDIATMGKEAAVTYEKFGLDSTLRSAFELPIFFQQATTIFIIVTVLAVFPFWKISRLKPVEAMRA